jgi:hypothetical protein
VKLSSNVFTDQVKIEQFIESIFPSQQPPPDRKAPATIEEAKKKQKEDSEANWDLIYIVAAVIGTVLVMTSIMVCFRVISILTLLTLTSCSLPTLQEPDLTLLGLRPSWTLANF